MTTALTVLTIIATLAALVFFHELGHFVTAKCLGVGVKIFSLGFGPKLMACTVGETEYRLSLIPLGGYVTFNEPASKNTEPSAIVRKSQKDRSFDNASVLVRTLIVLAGPVWNFVLAFVICWGLFWVNGITTIVPEVGYVEPNSPAARAGILVGDRVIAFGEAGKMHEPSSCGQNVDWMDIVHTVSSNTGAPLHISVLRNGQEMTLDIMPVPRLKIGNDGSLITVGHVGFAPTGEQQKRELGLMAAAMHGANFTWNIVAETGKAFGMLIMGHLPSDSIGGPIMISQAISEHAERGASVLFALIAIISVNLGLVNLLPLPVLDGGHIVMFMLEAARGRPVSEAVQKNFQRVGLALLLLLMLWGTYNDVMRI
ncbi:MAG: RIP metalloprotease RseP [Pseudomonadota bacterium]